MTRSSFYQDVYDVVQLIPKGRVSTYGAIANYLGSRLSARMVGWALSSCPKNRRIPAHRVVNRAGLLSGKHHFENPSTMADRLKKEGMTIRKDQIVNFKEVFWDPSHHLTLP